MLLLDWLSKSFQFTWKTFWLCCEDEGKIIATNPFYFPLSVQPPRWSDIPDSVKKMYTFNDR